MKKCLMIGFSLLILLSCVAALPKKALEGNTFISHNPMLEVNFKKPIRKMEPLGGDYIFYFNAGLPVRINFYRMRHRAGNIFFFPLEKIAKNRNGIYLGSIKVDGSEWAKVAYLNKKGYLLTGYFTRKDTNFINIYNYRQLNTEQQEKYRQLKNGLKRDPSYLKEYFQELNQTLEIIR